MNYTDRKSIPENYTWDLSIIFPSKEDWLKEYNKLSVDIEKIVTFKGKLSDRNTALELLTTSSKLEKRIEDLFDYACRLSDLDTRDTENSALVDKIFFLYNNYGTYSAYISPEFTALSNEKLDSYIADKDFANFTRMLQGIKKTKAHVLSEPEEKILAMASGATGRYSDTFNMINNADIKFPTVTDDNGKEYKVTHGTYGLILAGNDRKLREKAFKAYYQVFRDNINTIASTYSGSVKADWFYAKARKYNSCIEKALENEEVPQVVYDNLINAIHKYNPVMHDYMKLRRDVLGYEELHMWDMHTPIVGDCEFKVDIEEAEKIVIKALAPLGADYQKLLETAFSERWVDVYETPGKRSGAYSSGTYGRHPLVLLNYQENLDNVFTIAHELGHAMHSYKSNNAQCYEKAGYKIFLAEIASTTNEVLLLKHLIANTEDNEMKKMLLAHYVDMFRTTVFRQSMFAEFEQIAHAMEENGEPLTSKSLSDKYYELNKEYYGPYVVSDEDIAIEWARIPHFYTPFYVYKYSTGLISAVCIANKILKEGQPMVDKYMNFLSAGDSMEPIEILKMADVDLTTNDPFNFAMNEMKEALEELKKLIK